MQIKFIVDGNQEDHRGNPVPYHRTTQKARWTREARRYESWKCYVREKLIRHLEHNNCRDMLAAALRNIAAGLRPLANPAGNKQRIDLFIHWANNAHGDPDNILKGINDALYQNDKHVAGSVDFDYSPERKGSAEITLTL